jgi:Replicative DNA helicase
LIDLTAEKSLLGAVLISPRGALPVARSRIKASDILHEDVRAAYIAACELADAGETIDPVTVIKQAGVRGENITGSLLADCMNTALTAANIEFYADAVHDGAIKRVIQELGAELSEDSPEPPQEILRSAICRLQDLQLGSNIKPEAPVDDAMAFYTALREASEGKQKPFLQTGFKTLDELLGGGLVSAGLITLAARTGTGKTVMGLCLADNIAAKGHQVLYVSLEMGRGQIMARRVGRLTGLSYNLLQRGTIQADDNTKWSRIAAALSLLSKRPLFISDKPATIVDVELKARSIPGLRLIVIDHMGFLKPENPRSSLYQQTSEASHALKMLALSMNVPILSLCQLNRENEGRIGHRPGLADLRNSGAIEEDSDAVILLHRPSTYLLEEERPRPWEEQELDVIIAKNRHGATGEARFAFRGMTADVLEKGDYQGLTEVCLVPAESEG